MKNKFHLLPLLLFLTLAVAAITGCERNRELHNDQDRAAAGTLGPDESLEEAGVTAKVRTGLARDERAGELALEDIEVETHEGVVVLKGAVGGEGARTAAEEIARATDGVSGVVNRITIG